ncbi:MAG: HAD family hydrolase [Candidatus Altiarchaeota archaeon]
MTLKAILFDWDGVLFDVFDFMVETYQEVMAEVGVPVWSRLDFQLKMRNDWRTVLPEMGLFAHEELLIKRWDERQVKTNSLGLFSGVEELICELPHDYSLGIVSSAPKIKITEELQKHHLLYAFNTVVAYEDCHEVKPSPKPLFLASSHLSVKPDKCIYVGDMVEDIKAAKAAGMPSIAVTWGIHTKEKLEKEDPDIIVENLTELQESLLKL